MSKYGISQRNLPVRFHLTIQWGPTATASLSANVLRVDPCGSESCNVVVKRSYFLTAFSFLKSVIRAFIFIARMRQRKLILKGKLIYEYRNFSQRDGIPEE